MSTIDETTHQALEESDPAVHDLDPEPVLTLDLELSEAAALRAWLLKPAGDGTTALDDPLVSRALAELGRSVDAVSATVNVRRELRHAGLDVDRLSDEEVRELGRRVADAASPGVRG